MRPVFTNIKYLCLLSFLLIPQNLYAQGFNKASTSEDVALLFYKSGSSIPNFSKWIENSPEYHLTPIAARADKMLKEKTKLQKRYLEINPENELLRVKVPVEISLSTHTAEDKSVTHILSLKFSDANKADYFPYPFMGQQIAVIPTNLKYFKNNYLSASEFERIQNILESGSNKTFRGVVEMKAQKPDLAKPHNLDGVDQWIFRTKIAIFSIFDRKGHILWEKMESWYTSPITENLNNLYDGQYKQEPEYIGATTPHK